jgi:hypothetical protein
VAKALRTVRVHVLRRNECDNTASATAITSDSFFNSYRNTLPIVATDGRIALMEDT